MNDKIHIEKKNSEDLTVSQMELDLLGILCKIINIRKRLYWAAGIGLIIGIIVALSIPKQYTVKVTLSPEMGNQKNNSNLVGLAASFLGEGSTMGNSIDALNASISADIVASTPFLLELLNMNVSVKDMKVASTLNLYLGELSSPWWSNVIELPNMVIGGIKKLFTDDNDEVANNVTNGAIELSRKDMEKIEYLRKQIVASVDKKTAITEITVTLQDPKVTAIVADSVVRKLQEYIINYRTSKAKEDCLYLEQLFKERQREYYLAQKKYANYVDTHDNLILLSVRTEQERLLNDMNLAFQIYSQVANQLQITRAKVQEEKPVFAVVEPAVVPLSASGIGLKIYVLLFMALAILGTLLWVLLVQKVFCELKEKLSINS